jgi:hypothetical protein
MTRLFMRLFKVKLFGMEGVESFLLQNRSKAEIAYPWSYRRFNQIRTTIGPFDLKSNGPAELAESAIFFSLMREPSVSLLRYCALQTTRATRGLFIFASVTKSTQQIFLLGHYFAKKSSSQIGFHF